MRVALIPTGRMELAGLGATLQRVFPDHDFHALASRPDGTPFDSFTSSDVSVLLRPRVADTHLDRLVAALAAAVMPGRRHRDEPRNDVVMIVDDLELANLEQPDQVVDAVRVAILRHLDHLTQSIGARFAERTARALREKASFHLAVPMAEAWFFAPGSPMLAAAGVPAARLPPNLVAGRDPESFETRDTVFSSDNGSSCTALLAAAARRRRVARAAWVCDDRERHPKAYVQWLCRDPGYARCTTYRESHEGVAALAVLDWQQVLGPPEQFKYARSMLNDLADAIGTTPFPGVEAALTSRSRSRPEALLRNI